MFPTEFFKSFQIKRTELLTLVVGNDRLSFNRNAGKIDFNNSETTSKCMSHRHDAFIAHPPDERDVRLGFLIQEFQAKLSIDSLNFFMVSSCFSLDECAHLYYR